MKLLAKTMQDNKQTKPAGKIFPVLTNFDPIIAPNTNDVDN